jgi:hypothetical protein
MKKRKSDKSFIAKITGRDDATTKPKATQEPQVMSKS